MSFLDMIGASDIAYIICLMKNSMDIWKFDSADTTKTMPKPLFTRGQKKKRKFGKAMMSDEGMKYFQKGITNWKMAFNNRRGEIYATLVEGWNAWLKEEASSIDIEGGWRRKNLHSLLRVREEEDNSVGDDEVDDEGQDGEVGELTYSYDSDGDEGFMAPVPRGRSQRRTMMDANRDDEDEGEGGAIDDDNNDNNDDNRKRGYEDDIYENDEDDNEEDETYNKDNDDEIREIEDQERVQEDNEDEVEDGKKRGGDARSNKRKSAAKTSVGGRKRPATRK